MNPLNWFPGYKTYILAGAAILGSLAGWMDGSLAMGGMVENIGTALMAMTIRKGIAG